jgi:hypothetical protein
MRTVEVQPFEEARKRRAKSAFTTRRVPADAMRSLVSGPMRPRSGDLVLARVERLGHHTKLELPSGRRALMHVGDEILVAFGDRYATDQFEAEVPLRLNAAHLVASGGVASRMVSRSARARRPTEISPLGLVGDQAGRPLNLTDFALPEPDVREGPFPPTIAVLGTAMNAGKTTTAHRIVHALARAGYRVGATKVTGTGSGNDFWLMLDAGAHQMLDFTDVGMASTYRVDFRLVEQRAIQLLDHLVNEGCEAIVVEVADGLFQRETDRLLQSPSFRARIDGVVFASGDAMGAYGAMARLRELDVPVRALAGRVTQSPLATRELAAVSGDVPVRTLEELGDPLVAAELLGLSPGTAGLVEPSLTTGPGAVLAGDGTLIDLSTLETTGRSVGSWAEGGDQVV